jgi:hypothetical protein
MRRRLGNGLVWAGLVLGVPALCVTLGPARETDVAPGHDTAACRPCRTGTPFRGQPLPYELDGRNIHTADTRNPAPVTPADLD